MDSVKRNLRSQLNNIDVEEKDGTIVNLGEKFGNKAGHQKTDVMRQRPADRQRVGDIQ